MTGRSHSDLANDPSARQETLVQLLEYLPADSQPHVVEWALQARGSRVSPAADCAIAALAPYSESGGAIGRRTKGQDAAPGQREGACIHSLGLSYQMS